MHEIVGSAFVDGFRAAMLTSAALALAGALSVWWLITGRKHPDSKGTAT